MTMTVTIISLLEYENNKKKKDIKRKMYRVVHWISAKIPRVFKRQIRNLWVYGGCFGKLIFYDGM